LFSGFNPLSAQADIAVPSFVMFVTEIYTGRHAGFCVSGISKPATNALTELEKRSENGSYS